MTKPLHRLFAPLTPGTKQAQKYSEAIPDGTSLRDFRIDRVLGRGGFAISYLASSRTEQKPLVIKEFLPKKMAFRTECGRVEARPDANLDILRQGVDGFIREASLLDRLAHCNIPRILEQFEENGTGYIVMSHEKGTPLDAVLGARAGQIDSNDLEYLWGEMLHTLLYLAAQGIVHGDISPANILIRPNGAPMLIDFGNATHRGSQYRATSATVCYTAPEVWSGFEPPSAQSDIYSLACVLYYAVSGVRPPSARQRLNDISLAPLVPAARSAEEKNFFASIDKALSRSPQRRLRCAPSQGLATSACQHRPRRSGKLGQSNASKWHYQIRQKQVNGGAGI